MLVTREISADCFEGWCGAEDTLRVIISKGKIDDFDNLIEELYPDGIDETTLNDILRFDYEWLFETLGISEDEEDEEDSDSEDEENSDEDEEDEEDLDLDEFVSILIGEE